MSKIGSYIQECSDELINKVSWPAWNDLQSSSIIVVIASFIIAFMVFLMDYVFGANGQDALFKGVLGYIYEMF